MRKILFILTFAAAASFAQDAEEWQAFRKTGLFTAESVLWIAPDMEKETVSGFASRLMESARQGDAKAMATLGRVFFVRGDAERAGEWIEKAAEAGHGGAQFDLGVMLAQGNGRAQDFLEAYKWLWLATWADAPGADAVLREVSGKLNAAQVLDGVQRAAKFQDAHAKQSTAPAGP